MYEAENTLLSAAKALAKDLAFPKCKASVFAWCDQSGERIVVAIDHFGLRQECSIPSSFRGYRVEVQDSLGAEVIIPKR